MPDEGEVREGLESGMAGSAAVHPAARLLVRGDEAERNKSRCLVRQG